jgi:quinol monooxygenase YgiN
MGKQLLFEVRYTVKEGKRQEFVQKLKEADIAEKTRKEKGNERYEYFYPVEDINVVFLMEVWDTAEDQKAHMLTPHIQVLTALKKEYVRETSFKKSLIEQIG